MHEALVPGKVAAQPVSMAHAHPVGPGVGVTDNARHVCNNDILQASQWHLVNMLGDHGLKQSSIQYQYGEGSGISTVKKLVKKRKRGAGDVG